MKTLKPNILILDTKIGSPPAVERIRGYRLTQIRERIALRDEYTCRICGRIVVKGEVDHVVPLFMGGFESDFNRQWICPACHRVKSDAEEKGRGL